MSVRLIPLTANLIVLYRLRAMPLNKGAWPHYGLTVNQDRSERRHI